eukprot:10664487-Karenia_brevis.AAC.1
MLDKGMGATPKCEAEGMQAVHNARQVRCTNAITRPGLQACNAAMVLQWPSGQEKQPLVAR